MAKEPPPRRHCPPNPLRHRIISPSTRHRTADDFIRHSRLDVTADQRRHRFHRARKTHQRNNSTVTQETKTRIGPEDSSCVGGFGDGCHVTVCELRGDQCRVWVPRDAVEHAFDEIIVGETLSSPNQPPASKLSPPSIKQTNSVHATYRRDRCRQQ